MHTRTPINTLMDYYIYHDLNNKTANVREVL